MRPVRVKLCGMRRTADVEAAIEAGADAIGFVVFSPRSSRNLDLDTAARLVSMVPAFVTPVMVTAETEPAHVLTAAARTHAGAVQLPATAAPGLVDALRDRGLPIIVAADPAEIDAGHVLASRADAVLLDATRHGYGGTGQRLDLSVAAGRVRTLAPIPVVLAGGLTPENVADAITSTRPHGVDVSSGIETDGEKDPALMRAFVNAARRVMHGP